MIIKKYKENKIFSHYDIDGQLITLPNNKKINNVLQNKNLEEMQTFFEKEFLRARNKSIGSFSILAISLIMMLSGTFLHFDLGTINIGMIGAFSAALTVIPVGIISTKSDILKKVKDIVEEELIIEEERKRNIIVVKEKEQNDTPKETIQKKEYNYSREKYDNVSNVIYPDFGGNSKKNK